MSIKDMFRRLCVAHGHTEPIGALDRLDGRTDGPTEAADPHAEGTTPESGEPTGPEGSVRS